MRRLFLPLQARQSTPLQLQASLMPVVPDEEDPRDDVCTRLHEKRSYKKRESVCVRPNAGQRAGHGR